MPTAVGYVRVSTEEQSKEGVSLAMQRTKIRQYCQLNDLDLIEIIEDAGISAKDIDHRPGFKRIIEKVNAGTIDAVIVYKLDRAFRNTVQALTVAQDMDKKGVAFHSITEKLDTRSAIGKFFFTLLSALAEMERNIISERTTAALRHKRANGERTTRHAPIGYSHLNGLLVLDQNEQTAILQALNLRAQGLSLREISRALFREGHRSRTNGMLSAATIAKMISPSVQG
jgi:site-specific DNA recombinase